jgi:hypothetical protein
VITATLDAMALLLLEAGVVVLAVGLTFGARWLTAIPVALELWAAASLLRPSGSPSWPRIATAAAIILIRRVITWRDF